MGTHAPVDDRFGRFGIVGFTAATKLNDFIDYLEDGRVMGTQCKRCLRTFFPPRSDCWQCLSSDMEWFEVSGTGRLAAYSRLAYAPAGFEEDLPYAVAVVDYGDFKVFGRLSPEISVNELKTGMAMRTEAISLPEGRLIYVFRKA